MKIFFYSATTDENLKRFRRELELVVPKRDIKCSRTKEHLYKLLHLSAMHYDLVILHVSRAQELTDLYQFQDVLQHTLLIIILPDRSKNMVSQAYRFRPRLVSYCDADDIEFMMFIKTITNLKNKSVP
ncbi:MAG: hypothetical protein JXA41_06915 [Deltaproteobacteria bacterium]|nr:hypothetical protein [Deltaproteobacteria bacterium]